jgi:hypothetical protein
MKYGVITGLILFLVHVSNAQSNVLSHEVLKNYIFTEVVGYTSIESSGNTVNLDGVSFSNSIIKYENQSGNYIRIVLLDYSDAENLYKAALALWETGRHMKSIETVVDSYDNGPSVVAWEEYRQNEEIAIVALGVANRFFITIEADNQKGADLVKDIAQNLKLNQLTIK